MTVTTSSRAAYADIVKSYLAGKTDILAAYGDDDQFYWNVYPYDTYWKLNGAETKGLTEEKKLWGGIDWRSRNKSVVLTFGHKYHSRSYQGEINLAMGNELFSKGELIAKAPNDQKGGIIGCCKNKDRYIIICVDDSLGVVPKFPKVISVFISTRNEDTHEIEWNLLASINNNGKRLGCTTFYFNSTGTQAVGNIVYYEEEPEGGVLTTVDITSPEEEIPLSETDGWSAEFKATEITFPGITTTRSNGGTEDSGQGYVANDTWTKTTRIGSAYIASDYVILNEDQKENPNEPEEEVITYLAEVWDSTLDISVTYNYNLEMIDEEDYIYNKHYDRSETIDCVSTVLDGLTLYVTGKESRILTTKVNKGMNGTDINVSATYTIHHENEVDEPPSDVNAGGSGTFYQNFSSYILGIDLRSGHIGWSWITESWWASGGLYLESELINISKEYPLGMRVDKDELILDSYDDVFGRYFATHYIPTTAYFEPQWPAGTSGAFSEFERYNQTNITGDNYVGNFMRYIIKDPEDNQSVIYKYVQNLYYGLNIELDEKGNPIPIEVDDDGFPVSLDLYKISDLSGDPDADPPVPPIVDIDHEHGHFEETGLF